MSATFLLPAGLPLPYRWLDSNPVPTDRRNSQCPATGHYGGGPPAGCRIAVKSVTLLWENSHDTRERHTEPGRYDHTIARAGHAPPNSAVSGQYSRLQNKAP